MDRDGKDELKLMHVLQRDQQRQQHGVRRWIRSALLVLLPLSPTFSLTHDSRCDVLFSQQQQSCTLHAPCSMPTITKRMTRKKPFYIPYRKPKKAFFFWLGWSGLTRPLAYNALYPTWFLSQNKFALELVRIPQRGIYWFWPIRVIPSQ